MTYVVMSLQAASNQRLTVIPAKAGIQSPPSDQLPPPVRPEHVEEPALSLPKRRTSPVPYSSFPRKRESIPSPPITCVTSTPRQRISHRENQHE